MVETTSQCFHRGGTLSAAADAHVMWGPYTRRILEDPSMCTAHKHTSNKSTRLFVDTLLAIYSGKTRHLSYPVQSTQNRTRCCVYTTRFIPTLFMCQLGRARAHGRGRCVCLFLEGLLLSSANIPASCNRITGFVESIFARM
jgi:hypothetical protein